MWWKFSEYEIKGEYIQPTPNALMIEYDPIELFQGKANELRGSRPYLGFIQALTEINRSADGAIYEGVDKLLKWVHEYGLLGLFWHDAILVQSPAKETAPGLIQAPVIARLGGRWIDCGFKEAVGGGPPPSDGILIESGMGPYSVAGEAEVVPFEYGVGIYFEKPSELNLHPSNEITRRAYRECIENYLDRTLFNVGDAVDGHAGTLNYLLSGVTDWIEPTPKTKRSPPSLRITRVYASLFSLFGWMIYKDRIDGQTIFQCHACGKQFLSNRSQAKYCSDSCRSRLHKRRSRAALRK